MARPHTASPMPSALDVDPRLVSLEYEQRVLGSLIIDPDLIETAQRLLATDDFFSPAYRTAFRVLGELRAEHFAIETFSVVKPFQKALSLTDEEARRFAMGLSEVIPTLTNLEFYCKRVRALANKRRYFEAARDLQQRALEVEDDAEIGGGALDALTVIRNRATTRRIVPTSAADLQMTQIPPVKFVAQGALPQGVALLHSRPKTGKTRLGDSLGISVATGNPFLGDIPVERSRVLSLYLEDSNLDTKERLQGLLGDELWPDNLDYFWEWPRLDKGGLSDLDDYLRERTDCGLVIIDTLQMIRPERRAGGDIYAEDVAAVSQLKRLSIRHNNLILILHHSTKRSEVEDLVESVSGTAGVSGSVDTILRLRRRAGTDEAILEGRGRKVRDFAWLLFLDNLAGWQRRGDAEEVQRSDEKKETLGALRESGPMRPQDLSEILDIPRGTSRQRLRRLALDGLVRNQGGFYVLTEGQSCVTPVTPVTPIADVSRNAVTPHGLPYISEEPLPPPEEYSSSPFVPEENGRVTDATPVTGVTSVTPVTDVTPVTYKNGGIPLPSPLDLPPDAKDPELRRSTFNLAFARSFPEVVLSASVSVGPGEEDWRRHCTRGFLEWVTRSYARLGGEG